MLIYFKKENIFHDYTFEKKNMTSGLPCKAVVPKLFNNSFKRSLFFFFLQTRLLRK